MTTKTTNCTNLLDRVKWLESKLENMQSTLETVLRRTANLEEFVGYSDDSDQEDKDNRDIKDFLEGEEPDDPKDSDVFGEDEQDVEEAYLVRCELLKKFGRDPEPGTKSKPLNRFMYLIVKSKGGTIFPYVRNIKHGWKFSWTSDHDEATKYENMDAAQDALHAAMNGRYSHRYGEPYIQNCNEDYELNW